MKNITKHTSLSKYQKEIVKRLIDLLGTSIPFSYERTGKNHLKVLIDGIDKPYYTSSTPSDRRSAVNFIADIKRELKVNDISQAPLLVCESRSKVVIHKAVACEKVASQTIKNIRSRVSSLISHELDFVQKNNSVDVINSYRITTVRNTISYVSKRLKPPFYATKKELQAIEDAVIKHVNFILPSKAYYAQTLKNEAPAVVNIENRAKSTWVAVGKSKAVNEHVVKEKLVNKTTTTTLNHGKQVKLVDKVPVSNSIDNHEVEENKNLNWLTNQNNASQVSTFKALKNEDAQRFIENIKQAMACNRDKAVLDIVSLMEANDVDVNMLTEHLSKVA